MTADDLVDRELMLHRFRKLIAELVRGEVRRTVFQPWEIELLLDIESCALDGRRRIGTLQRYERAVTRQLEHGPGPPMKVSEYLERRKRTRPPEPLCQAEAVKPGTAAGKSKTGVPAKGMQ